MNPVLADDRGVLAVDARVVLRPVPAGAVPYAHLAIHPYPADLEGVEELPGGARLVVRPIRPEDAEIENAFVDALSPDSLRLRFHSGLRHLTPTMLARFTQIDYDREMALVAVDMSGAAPRQVAVVRYIRLPDARTCEFAIVIADDWQGRGLGRRMLLRLIGIARSRDLDTMTGYVLTSNAAMIALCTSLGFASEPEPGDALNRRMTLDLR